jgi:hypothetical protein
MPKSTGRKTRTKSKNKNKQAPKSSKVTIHYEGIAPHFVAEFERVGNRPLIQELWPERGLINRRVHWFVSSVQNLVPTGTRVRVRITASMAETMRHVDPEHYGGDASYTTDRGANIATAKTVRADDGSFDIVVNYARFVSFRSQDADEVAENTTSLAHLAAHEPQHILMDLDKTDVSFVLKDARGESATVNDLLVVFAEAVNEFRCELAANRIAISGTPQDLDFADDLASFRSSLNNAVAVIATDRHAACVRTMMATKELMKAVAYIAAYYIAQGRSDDLPSLPSDQWERYMASLWPDLMKTFTTIPASDELADTGQLADAIYTGAERVLAWLEEIGVTYQVTDGGERACWWQLEEPF